MELHVLAVSALGVGHYTPMGNFLRSLLLRNFSCRIYVSFFAPVRETELSKSPILNIKDDRLSTYVHVLSGDDVHATNMNAMITRHDELLNSAFNFVTKNQLDYGWPNVNVIIHDLFSVFVIKLADEIIRKPRIIFETSHSFLYNFISNPKWIKDGIMGNRYLDIPGINRPIDLKLAAKIIQDSKDEPVIRIFDLKCIISTSAGVITGDLDMWSEATLEYFKLPHTSVFNVGPMCVSKRCESKRTSLNEWLDNQDDETVIIVSLGTLYEPTLELILNISNALLLTARAFVWSIKGGIPDDIKMKLSQQGVVTQWMDTRMVLSHRSAGVFVTHGGWNSVSENIVFGGLPMVFIPLGAEQGINAALFLAAGMGNVGVMENKDWAPESGCEPEFQWESPSIISDNRLTNMLNHMWVFMDSKNLADVIIGTRNDQNIKSVVRRKQLSVLQSTLPYGEQQTSIESLIEFFKHF